MIYRKYVLGENVKTKYNKWDKPLERWDKLGEIDGNYIKCLNCDEYMDKYAFVKFKCNKCNNKIIIEKW